MSGEQLDLVAAPTFGPAAATLLPALPAGFSQVSSRRFFQYVKPGQEILLAGAERWHPVIVREMLRDYANRPEVVALAFPDLARPEDPSLVLPCAAIHKHLAIPTGLIPQKRRGR